MAVTFTEDAFGPDGSYTEATGANAADLLWREIGAVVAPNDPPPSTGSRSRRSAMDEATARALIQDHFDAYGHHRAGGGPGDEIAAASEIYADDAVLEFPQGGERVRGKANIIAMRSAYPARLDLRDPADDRPPGPVGQRVHHPRTTTSRSTS